MANSLKSPKNPFRVEIHYKKRKSTSEVLSVTQLKQQKLARHSLNGKRMAKKLE